MFGELSTQTNRARAQAARDFQNMSQQRLLAV